MAGTRGREASKMHGLVKLGIRSPGHKPKDAYVALWTETYKRTRGPKDAETRGRLKGLVEYYKDAIRFNKDNPKDLEMLRKYLSTELAAREDTLKGLGNLPPLAQKLAQKRREELKTEIEAITRAQKLIERISNK